MRRLFAAVIIALSLAGSAHAQASLSGLYPKDARSMGMGGAFGSLATGYQAFFGNPAGFAGPGSLTIADLSAWAYLRPTPENLRDIAEASDGQMTDADKQALVDRLIAENGLGGGASAGLGWSGKGFGLGLNIVSDALATGTSSADATIKVRNQANAVIGMAMPLELGPFAFSIGVDIRAFYRLDSSGEWSFATLAAAAAGGQGMTAEVADLMTLGGVGLALDTGATLKVGPLTAGFMVRDYGYRFSMGEASVGELVEDWAFPLEGVNAYALTPIYTAGLGLDLRNNSILTTSLYAEVDDPITFFTTAGSDLESAVALVHAGAELEFLKFIALRAGINRGLVSVGAGLDFALFEIDAAFFSQYVDSTTMPQGRSGIALQAAVRF